MILFLNYDGRILAIIPNLMVLEIGVRLTPIGKANGNTYKNSEKNPK
jgi:hypothetical protein